MKPMYHDQDDKVSAFLDLDNIIPWAGEIVKLFFIFFIFIFLDKKIRVWYTIYWENICVTILWVLFHTAQHPVHRERGHTPHRAWPCHTRYRGRHRTLHRPHIDHTARGAGRKTGGGGIINGGPGTKYGRPRFFVLHDFPSSTIFKSS